jgi:hypothetical protein
VSGSPRVSFGLHQGSRHRYVKARHPLGAAGHVVKFLAAFDCPAEVRYGFPDGGSRHSSLSRILPVVERTARIASFLKMVRKEFGVLLDRLSPKLYQSSGDLAVQLRPLVTKKGADGRLLNSLTHIQCGFTLCILCVRNGE